MTVDKKEKHIFILCFGNPHLKCDSLAVLVADYFSHNPVNGLEFVKCVSPDEVMNYTGKNFFILDVVKDLEEVRFFDDINMLEANNLISLHDFDLGFFLKLMKQTGKLDTVRIIGIPMDRTVKDVKDDIISIIEKN